jgi:hypothetical protein
MNYKKLKSMGKICLILILFIYPVLGSPPVVSVGRVEISAKPSMKNQKDNHTPEKLEIPDDPQVTSAIVKIKPITVRDNEETDNTTLRKQIREYKKALDIPPVVMVKVGVWLSF